LDTFKRLYQSPNGPLRNNCIDTQWGQSGEVDNFYETLYFCLEDKVTDESETTTSGQFGNMFDAYDYDSYEKYKSLEDLLNSTKIDITDILRSYTFGNVIKVEKQLMGQYAKENFEADWKANLHHKYGYCYTFDHSKIENREKVKKVKVITKTKNDVSGDLLQSYLLFDVSPLIFNA